MHYLVHYRNHGKIEIIRALHQLRGDRTKIVATMTALQEVFNINNPNVLRMLETAGNLGNVQDAAFQAFVNQGKSIIHRFMRSHEKMDILYHLSKVPDLHRGSIENFINFTMRTAEKIEILEICGNIPQESFEFVIQQFSNFIKITTNFENRKKLIRNLANIPEANREQFNRIPSSERQSNTRDIRYIFGAGKSNTSSIYENAPCNTPNIHHPKRRCSGYIHCHGSSSSKPTTLHRKSRSPKRICRHDPRTKTNV